MNIENPKINYHKNYFVSIHNYTMKMATVTVGTSEPFITRFLKLFLTNIFFTLGQLKIGEQGGKTLHEGKIMERSRPRIIKANNIYVKIIDTMNIYA